MVKVRRDSKFGAYLPGQVTDAPELLRREFDELSRAYRYFERRSNGLRVVRPIDYCEDLNAVFIEKASGGDLGLVARTRRGRSRSWRSRRCGKWLRAYHEKVHQPRPRVWTLGEFEARLMKRREKLVALGVPGSSWISCSEVIQAARACRQREVPWSLLHGDYKLRHIWAKPRRDSKCSTSATCIWDLAMWTSRPFSWS